VIPLLIRYFIQQDKNNYVIVSFSITDFSDIKFFREEPMFEVSEKAAENIKQMFRERDKIPSIRVTIEDS
jgi:hypothetical protein